MEQYCCGAKKTDIWHIKASVSDDASHCAAHLQNALKNKQSHSFDCLILEAEIIAISRASTRCELTLSMKSIKKN